MRCPRCSTPPPFDPFVCTTCGEYLATYLDEPLGPGTGVGARAAGAGGRPSQVMTGARAGGFDATALTPAVVGAPSEGDPRPYQTGMPPRPPRQADNTGPFILKLLFGLFVAMILFSQGIVGGLLFLVVLLAALARWPRMQLIPFVGAAVGAAAAIWIVVELIDAIDTPSRRPPLTPTPNRAATSTAIAVGGTPTLAPAQRTATATVVAGENRVKLSRARARWLRGDNATALAELNDALTLIPGLPETLNLRALVRISAGDYDGAVADAERASTAQPSNPSYRDTRGYALLKLQRYAAAADEYDRVLAGPRPESNVAASLGRGIARTAQGQLAEARTDLERGLRLLPDTDPDPQLADLEILARRALDPLAPRPGSPGGSPAPAVTPAPAASPVASPAVLLPFSGPRVHPP